MFWYFINLKKMELVVQQLNSVRLQGGAQSVCVRACVRARVSR